MVSEPVRTETQQSRRNIERLTITTKSEVESLPGSEKAQVETDLCVFRRQDEETAETDRAEQRPVRNPTRNSHLSALAREPRDSESEHTHPSEKTRLRPSDLFSFFMKAVEMKLDRYTSSGPTAQEPQRAMSDTVSLGEFSRSCGPGGAGSPSIKQTTKVRG